MEVTFRTLEQLLDLNKDVRGLVKHGLAMSEKAAAGVYHVDAFIKYDEAVRDRAGQHGPGTFGQVSQKDLRIDYGDGRVIKGSSTKMVISQIWNVIFRHAIHH